MPTEGVTVPTDAAVVAAEERMAVPEMAVPAMAVDERAEVELANRAAELARDPEGTPVPETPDGPVTVSTNSVDALLAVPSTVTAEPVALAAPVAAVAPDPRAVCVAFANGPSPDAEAAVTAAVPGAVPDTEEEEEGEEEEDKRKEVLALHATARFSRPCLCSDGGCCCGAASAKLARDAASARAERAEKCTMVLFFFPSGLPNECVF